MYCHEEIAPTNKCEKRGLMSGATTGLAEVHVMPIESQHQSRIESPSNAPVRLKLLVYTVSILAWAVLLVDGYSYYKTPLNERPHHEDYRALRPAGTRGLLLGIVGASMMVLMLGYSLRKRIRGLSRWGALPYWLDAHIYFGIMGPLCILLHTSFKIQGLVSIAFWSMVCVAVSGVLGRYLYSQIPRNMRGDQMSLEESRRERDALRARLRSDFTLSDAAIAHLERPHKPDTNAGAWSALASSAIEDIRSLIGKSKDTEAASRAGRSHDQIVQLNRIVKQMNTLDRRIEVWSHMQRLFHYWHVFHKPFAIVMYVIMCVHIVVAVWTGYGWFS